MTTTSPSKIEDARLILKRFGIQVAVDDLDTKTLASYLKVVWLSKAIKADAGVAGTMESLT